MDPQEQAALAAIGRQGWSIVARTPAPDSTPTTDRYGASVPGKYPEGAMQWTITDGKGHNQTLVVKPPAAYPGPYSADVNDPGSYQPNYQVIEPPKDVATSSTAEPGYTNVTAIRNSDGTSTYYGKNPTTGQFEKVPGMPTEAAAAGTTKQTPSDPSKWQQIKSPDGRVIALQDPVTGDRVSVPADAKPEKPQIVNGTGGAIYAWDGTSLKQLQAGKAEPKEGDTRQNVSGGYQIREKYQGGAWVTDPSFTPQPYSPDLANKPKEGDTRQNVVQGYSVQQVYRGGDWVVDPSVSPKPYTPQPPTTLSTSASEPYIVQRDPATGTISSVGNPNYQPQDLGLRVQQLQQQATAERDRINALPLPDDQKRQQFDTWWQENIQPQAEALQRQQSQTEYQNQRQYYSDQATQSQNEAGYERNRQDTALTAGQQAVKDAQATLPYRVGPGFGADFSSALHTLSGGGGAVSFSPSDFTYQMPDFNQIAEQATNRALAHISPYAAYKIGAPMPQPPAGLDIAGMLNQSRYTPTTTISPDGTVTIEHASGSQPNFAAASINDPSRMMGGSVPNYQPPNFAAASINDPSRMM